MKAEKGGYSHYHVSIYGENQGFELTICYDKESGKHKIDDWLGHFGEEDKILGEYGSVEEAVTEAIKLLKEKCPNGNIVYGAGAPPAGMLNKIMRHKKNE